MSASDVDNEDLTYDASVDGNASVEVQENILTISPHLDFNGLITVSFSVTDEEFIVEDSFDLTISPINDAPISPHPIISTSFLNYALPSVLKSKNKIASSAFLHPQRTNWSIGKNLSLSNIA